MENASELEELIQRAEDEGIHSNITQAALVEFNLDAVTNLFRSSSEATNDVYLLDEIAYFLRDQIQDLTTVSASKVLQTAISATKDFKEGHLILVLALARLDKSVGLPYLREYLSVNWGSVPQKIIQIQYDNNAVDALQDSHVKVQKAAAYLLQEQESAQELIEALLHKSTEVRRIVAWYLGRRKICVAYDSLVQQVKQEPDAETQRAMRWALEILEKYC